MIPARPRRPRDKAKVEAAVLIAERWILAVLRHRTFYSIEELRTAVAELSLPRIRGHHRCGGDLA